MGFAIFMPGTSRGALRAALLYLLASVIWLVLTDQILSSLFDDSARQLHWQLINGYVWVLATAAMIFLARARLLR